MLLWSRLKRSPLGSMRTWRWIMYPLIGVMVLVMFGLSLYQAYVGVASDDVSAYIGVPPDDGDLPPYDYKGAYLRLKPGADPRFPSNLIALLETTEAGVVDDAHALKVDGAAIDAVLINQSVIDDVNQYRVYAVGQESQETTARRLGGGRVLSIQPKTAPWAPGSYVIDAPSGGMFDTSRVYYAFTVR